jgi:hypothetical protein
MRGLPWHAGKAREVFGGAIPAGTASAHAGTGYTEAQVFWVAKHGMRRTGMFANGLWESDEKLWKAAAFIKRITALPAEVSAALDQKENN